MDRRQPRRVREGCIAAVLFPRPVDTLLRGAGHASYDSADRITALYEANRQRQVRDGALYRDAWPVLDRLLELRVPDQITLDTDEIESTRWEALKTRETADGTRRPLVVVYDEAQNLSD